MNRWTCFIMLISFMIIIFNFIKDERHVLKKNVLGQIRRQTCS